MKHGAGIKKARIEEVRGQTACFRLKLSESENF